MSLSPIHNAIKEKGHKAKKRLYRGCIAATPMVIAIVMGGCDVLIYYSPKELNYTVLQTGHPGSTRYFITISDYILVLIIYHIDISYMTQGYIINI